MESFKFSVFDIFSYLLPGLVALLGIVVLSTPTIIGLPDVVQIFQGFDWSTGIAVVVCAYIIGFSLSAPGSWFFQRVAWRLWGNEYHTMGVEGSGKISHTKQRVLVRHYSPENFSYLQIWKVVKNMAQNLSISVFFCAVVALFKFVQWRSFAWGSIVIGAAILGVMLLKRAHEYDRWHYRELMKTAEVLQLEQRAMKDAYIAQEKHSD